MCISTIMTRGDLFQLECGCKFYIENEDGETLEGIKISQHTGTNYEIIIADFPEVGEDGEAVIIEHDHLTVEGVFEHVPVALQQWGSEIRLCCEGRY